MGKHADLQVLWLDDRVFCVRRMKSDQTIFALTNLSADHLDIDVGAEIAAKELRDLISSRKVKTNAVTMVPYEILWLVSGPGN